MSKELVIKQETTHLIVSINKESPADLPFVISKKENSLTVESTLSCPLIANLKLDKKEILKSIRILVLYTAKQYKWSQNMEIQEASVIALDLYERFKSETIEDITLMFAKTRKGELKDRITQNPIKLNGRIDNETIFNVIVPAYLDLKAQERENAYMKAKNKPTEEVELTKEQLKYKKGLSKLAKKMKLENALKRSPDMKRRDLQFKTNQGKATSEEIKELMELDKKAEQKTQSPINELCQEHFAEYDRLKKYEPEKIPSRITSSYDYLKLKLGNIKIESNPITDKIIQKWATEFWELREQDKLPDGLDTYSKYFEWKTF